jgi:hypothetical protein
VAQADLAALDGAVLPVDSLREALPHLRRPFTPEAIKFKVQTAFPKADPAGCIVVAYIDARLVIERLNAVVAEAWTAEYHGTAKEQFMRCDLTVCGTSRSDVGQAAGLSKDLISDSLKRAAVHFGIGVSVYALPQITLWLNQERERVDDDGKSMPPRIEKRESGGKKTIVLNEHGHRGLRGGYAKWLEENGARLFGPALDHGDVEGDTVDEEQEQEEFVPPAPAALEDERADALRQEARSLFTEIQAVPGGAQAYPPGSFVAHLQQSSHSHEALEQLVAHVRTRHGQLVPKADA